MKISSVKTFLVKHQLPTWLANSYFQYDSRDALLIKLTTDDGLVGWGETAPMIGVRELIDKKVCPDDTGSGSAKPPQDLASMLGSKLWKWDRPRGTRYRTA